MVGRRASAVVTTLLVHGGAVALLGWWTVPVELVPAPLPPNDDRRVEVRLMDATGAPSLAAPRTPTPPVAPVRPARRKRRALAPSRAPAPAPPKTAEPNPPEPIAPPSAPEPKPRETTAPAPPLRAALPGGAPAPGRRAGGSLLDRVMAGGQTDPLSTPLTSELLAGLKKDPGGAQRAPSDEERAELTAKRWATVTSDPAAGLRARPPVDASDMKRTDDGGYEYSPSGWSARIYANGEVRFDDDVASYSVGEGHATSSAWPFEAVDLTRGEFDLTDVGMRAAGLDPYSSAKQCFLDDVEPIRMELRDKFRRDRLDEALAALAVRLDVIWRGIGAAQTRRRAVFELYDECQVGDAGARARQLIARWVQLNLPRGSPNAFSSAELAQLDTQRTGAVAFWPYGAPDADGGR